MSQSELVLLRGSCRLEFEGHEFEPHGSPGDWSDRCWLNVHPDAMKELESLLGTIPHFGGFEAEFYGYVEEEDGQYGHLGAYPCQVSMRKVVSARLPTPDPVEPSRGGGSIRERLAEIKRQRRRGS